MGAAAGQTHLLQDPRHGIADGRRGCQRKVDDAEGHAQPPGGFGGDQLADAGDLEGGLFDDVRKRGEVAVTRPPDGGAHHARAGHADVHGAFGLPDAVERPRHKGVILRDVGKDHQLCAADGALLPREIRRLFYSMPH